MLESRQCPVCGDFYWPPTQFCQRDGTALLAERTLIGQLLDDRYRIESLLGAGGMGTVYRAVHVHLDSAFAVKVLHPDMITNEAAIERFRREAKAARRIQHRNAIAVTDFGVTADKLVYLVMEFVEGRLLRELIHEGPFEYHRAADILMQTAAAVEAAHNSGVVHRDLKPDNIMIQKTGDKELVKVLDFGIAKLLEANQMSSPQRVLTKAGMIIGTPQYMSPEQCQGKELERASDIYSLGIIAYELLSGETPFVCDAQMQYISKHLYEAPPLLRSKAPRVPLSLEKVIMRTLEKDPGQRYESAQEFARELRDAVVEADEQLRADEQEPTKDQHRRAVPAATLVEVPVRVTPVPPGPATELISPLSEKPVSYTTRLTKAPQAPRSRKSWAIAAVALVCLSVAGYFAFSYLQKNNPDKSGEAIKAVQTVKDTPDGMVLIKGGVYQMGRNDREAEERPAHEVHVSDFYVDKTEVTNQQYKKFMDATEYAVPASWKRRSYEPGQSLLPVTGVTWYDASAFSKWAGKRLLREDEWEYIARKGGKTLAYPWGENWENNAANVSNERLRPFPVNSFENDVSLGVYDLIGNVSEWVDDFYFPYGSATNASASKFKVYRGGNFSSDTEEARATYRWYVEPNVPTDNKDSVFPVVGFRCAKNVK